MEVSQESVVSLLKDGLSDLVRLHWEEAYDKVEGIDLSVDWERYARLEEEGVVKWFSLRDGRELIGYSSVFETYPLHSKDSLSAIIDTIFVRKDKRKFRIGVSFIRCIKEIAFKDGCKQVTFFSREKVRCGALGRLLHMIGFKPYETSWIMYR